MITPHVQIFTYVFFPYHFLIKRYVFFVSFFTPVTTMNLARI